MPASLFVAAGHFGVRLVSDDGQAWRETARGKEGEVWRGSAFKGGRVVLVGTYGGANILGGSTDGVAWKIEKKDGKYSRYVRGLAVNPTEFVAIGGDPGSVGSSKPFLLTSPDGETWSDFTDIPGRDILRRLAWGNGLWVGVGDRGRRAVSKDGRTWEDVPKVRAKDTLVDVTYGNGVFVGVGLHGLRMRSADGLTWSAPALGDEGEHLNTVLWANDRFTAIGQGATWFSPDGTAWERRPNRDAPLTAVFGAGRFVGTNWKGRILTSVDAVEWREAFRCEHHLETVAFGELAPG